MTKLIFAAATALVLVASLPANAQYMGNDGYQSQRDSRSGGRDSNSNLGSPWGLLDDLARRLGFQPFHDPGGSRGADRARSRHEAEHRTGRDVRQ